MAGSIRSRRVIEVLARLESERGAPRYKRSDNGPEFVSNTILTWIHESNIETALNYPREAPAERQARKLQRAAARRMPEPGVVPIPARSAGRDRDLAPPLQRSPPTFEPRVPHARRISKASRIHQTGSRFQVKLGTKFAGQVTLHPDLQFVDQPGRALVCFNHRPGDQAQLVHQLATTQAADRIVRAAAQRRLDSVHPGCHRRLDPAENRTSSETYFCDRTLENPGTKAYTIAEARTLFARFASVEIRTVLTHGDLLESAARQRHRGPFLTIAKALWPRWLIRKLLPRHGLFLLARATK